MSEQPVAGWYADPTGRFEHRYWDGAAWTEHVSRQGQATVDALDGSTVHEESTLPIATGGWSGADRSGGDGNTGDWSAGAPVKRTNAKAVLSLVLSLAWVGGLGSIAAIVLGVMARRELRDRPDETGSGLATAGLVIGVVGVVGTVALSLLFAAFFAFGTAP